ncbi:Fungal Zn binuclear cluster domain containing protein [Penicillium mononematosum]|uniref:Fungal Zn binuclear cluster domain containing protein n=1 Tax=Penicillium mononematosum TaxID=268346 RepID=UPI002547BAF0|nr:Fungal Zn binuclear cluster domain containing protein [Penicillium mononematosum]KAJ6185529.1 Fungal Zn binuclear cluster domain containing protein [Penicillium mononematosum]
MAFKQHPDFNALFDANQRSTATTQTNTAKLTLGLILVRIIHKPTFLEEMQEYYLQVGQDNGVEKISTAAFEALLFVVLFSALTSLSEQEHWDPSPPGRDTAPGQLKQGCLQALRFAIEQSLVRSELHERPSLHSISACCLFLFVTCDETDVPYHYCLTGLLLRVARSYSLHVDPEALAGRRRIQKPARASLSAVVNEVRRRLWHVIVHLDFMSSEARGVYPEPVGIQTWPATLATALPGNMNDEDIVRSAREDNNNEGFTDMTMSLVRYQLSLGLRQLVTNPVPPAGSDTIQECLDRTVEIVERQYLQFCHTSDHIQKVTLEVGRLGEYKLRLIVYHWFLKGRDGTTNNSYWSPSRKRAMENAKNLISSYQNLLADPNIRRFHWHIRRHSQLHGMLHIINELSTIDTLNLPGDIQVLCKQAWETIADVEIEYRDSEDNSKEERLRAFLHNLREQVRLRLYTQKFIILIWPDYSSPMSGVHGTDVLESLFGGQLASFGVSGNAGTDLS